MIRPNKFSHPDQTIINASFLILKKIKKDRILTYDQLESFLEKKIKNGKFLFLAALNLLFLLGVITYHSKNDSFEFTEKEQ